MTQTVVLKVDMSTDGSASVVRRTLGRMEGVESFDIDLKEQKVIVKGNVLAEQVCQRIAKTGKKTSLWNAQAN